MPTEVKLQNRESFETLLSGKPLGDPAVGPDLPGVSAAADQTFAGESLSINVHGELSLSAFNSPDDKDQDGILGEASGAAGLDRLPPQIVLPDDAAYVKYRAAVGVKAAAGKKLENLGFAIEAEAGLVLTDYHRHPRDIVTRKAVIEGFTKLRSSLLLDDVAKLAIGEAVSHQVVGRLTAAVEVTWSDVFTGPIGPLSKLAGGAAVLIKVKGGASLRATVSLRDEFLLVFSKADDKHWRVGVRKARTRTAALGLDLGVTVQFANPAQVEGILNAAIDGVIGEPLDRVDAILEKATLGDLSDTEREIAERLIARFGLGAAIDQLQAIRDKIQEVRDRIKETVEAVAKAKIELGFAYEYRRIRQDTTVAQCLVSRAGLDKHHKNLVRGRFDELFADADRKADGSTLEHFLYQKSIKSEQSWGFSLSIGKWVDIGGRDRKTFLEVDRKSATNQIQRSYVGTRGYREAGAPRDNWGADFSASMPGFSRATTPLVSEFQTGLAVHWFEETDSLKEDVLSAWLDMAVLWGAATDADVARHRDSLAGALKQKCTLDAQITVPHEAFTIMRGKIASATPRELGPSLGAAMPWSKEAGRQTPTLRRQLYGPLWEGYLSTLDNASLSGRSFADAARRHLTKRGFPNLAAMEQIYAVSPVPHSTEVFCGLIDLNPSTIQNCGDFVNGARHLSQAALSAAPDDKTFKLVFEEMENLWAQSHHMRAVGAFLLETARLTGVLKHLGRSVSIGVATKGDRIVIAS